MRNSPAILLVLLIMSLLACKTMVNLEQRKVLKSESGQLEVGPPSTVDADKDVIIPSQIEERIEEELYRLSDVMVTKINGEKTIDEKINNTCSLGTGGLAINQEDRNQAKEQGFRSVVRAIVGTLAGKENLTLQHLIDSINQWKESQLVGGDFNVFADAYLVEIFSRQRQKASAWLKTSKAVPSEATGPGGTPKGGRFDKFVEVLNIFFASDTKRLEETKTLTIKLVENMVKDPCKGRSVATCGQARHMAASFLQPFVRSALAQQLPTNSGTGADRQSLIAIENHMLTLCLATGAADLVILSK